MFGKKSGVEFFQAKEGGSFTVLWNFFCLTRAKKLRLGTILRFRKFLLGKKFLWMRGGGGGWYHDFLSKSFCLTVPKCLVGDPFSVSLISGTKKVWIKRGRVSRFSVENYLSHSAEFLRRGILYYCISFGYQKSLDKKGASIKIFRRKFFVSQYR